MVRYAGTLNKAFRIERQITKTKWENLIELLKSGGYPIKMDIGTSLLLSVDGEPDADIEVFYTGNNAPDFVSIQLWYHKFNNPELNLKYGRDAVTLYSNLVDAVAYINELYTVITAERGNSDGEA